MMASLTRAIFIVLILEIKNFIFNSIALIKSIRSLKIIAFRVEGACAVARHACIMYTLRLVGIY